MESKRIRGWLLFYVILAIISIISLLLVFLVNLSYIFVEYNIFDIFLITSFFIMLSLRVVGVTLIFKKLKKAVFWNIFALWFNYFLFLLIIIISFTFLENFSTFSNFINAYIYLIINAIGPIVWTIYFRKSKRVKLTLIK